MLRPESSYGPGARRRPKEAAQRLTEIAQGSNNKELASAFAAFLALTERMRASLLSVIEILDRQPDLVEVESLLEETLRIFAPRGKTSQAREMVEGWWWPRVCTALMANPPGSIAVGELEAKLDEIRDYLKREALQLDFEEAEPSDAEASGYDGFRFIGQLRAIGVTGTRIQWAKRDYYRAFSQRSKWIREHAVNDGEVAKFERRLVEEWEPRFESMCVRHAETQTEDAKLMTAGQELFYWVETEARFPFRSLSPRSLSVGSYHILADDVRIGSGTSSRGRSDGSGRDVSVRLGGQAQGRGCAFQSGFLRRNDRSGGPFSSKKQWPRIEPVTRLRHPSSSVAPGFAVRSAD
jgi:hypothetical protein